MLVTCHSTLIATTNTCIVSPAALSGDILGRYIGNEPSSASHFETAQGWLESCISHTKCNETVSGSATISPYNAPLPTRVIEISRIDDHQQLHLRETDCVNGAYITLTHRWNETTGQCITTSSNYVARLQGEDLNDLPHLFLDAFIIAEKLGIKYIWIDSICIVQEGDGLVDWRREAPRMAQYYQFSVFTLAGTAEDISNGLLNSYGDNAIPWTSDLVSLPYRDKSNTLAGEFYAYKRRTPLVQEYMDQVRSSILFRRGWILQEWLLSKRILWYTPHGLFYECQQEQPLAYDQSQLTYSRANPELRAHLQLKADFHHSNPDILNFWYHALEVYSGQSLTKPHVDRILAVAGLAKEVGPILSGPKRVQNLVEDIRDEVYTAGIWLQDMYYGLLWEEDHEGEQSASEIEDIPTWSWASLMTRVKWSERDKSARSACKVTGICLRKPKKHVDPEHKVYSNHRLQPVDPATVQPQFDPTNMFSCLHIRGKLHTVHIRGFLASEDNLRRAALSTAYSPIPKSCSWRAVCSPFRPDIIAGWGSLERLELHPTACADSGVAVYALHVSTCYLRHGTWLKTSERVLDVLFLEEVADIKGIFKRIGVGRIADRQLITEFEEVEERNIQLV